MPLIVPTTGGFSIGSNVTTNEPKTTMNMSLDELMASRRKESVQATRKGGRTRVSTVDRSIATGRAKRNAAANARRNMTPTKQQSYNNNNNAPAKKKKATKMDIDREVKTQTARSTKAKVAADKKRGGRVAAAGGRRQRAATKAAGGTVRKAAPASKAKPQKAPTKKAVTAAVQAFRANGFPVPKGSQMVIRFEPAPGANNKNNNNNANNNKAKAKSPANNNNKAKGGRGGQAKKNNNNNTGGGRNNNANNNNRRSGGRGGGGGRGRR